VPDHLLDALQGETNLPDAATKTARVHVGAPWAEGEGDVGAFLLLVTADIGTHISVTLTPL